MTNRVKSPFQSTCSLLATVLGLVAVLGGARVEAQMPIKIQQLCRVKGQETGYLRGVGLVVGLAGTGDAEAVTTWRALARSLSGSGLRMPVDANGLEEIRDLEGTQGVALVFVTAVIPEAGARQGSKIHCQVDAMGGATNLAGGKLLEAMLTGGPFSGDLRDLPTIAVASGRVDQIDPTLTTTGKVSNGCQFVVDVKNTFCYYDEVDPAASRRMDMDPLNGTKGLPSKPDTPEQQLYFDLVIKDAHAGFGTAAEIVESLRLYKEFQTSEVIPIAKDPVTIRVPIPEQYVPDPVSFVAQILDIEVLSKPPRKVVTINKKTGVIIIGEGVKFDPTAISSPEFTVEAGAIRSLDLENNLPVAGGPGVELKKLVQALSQLQVSADTLIEIVEDLDEGGFLYGDVVVVD